jgi:hypothetical protein
MRNFIQMADNFYRDPDSIRRSVLEMPFAARDNAGLGWCTRLYHPRGVKERVEKTFRIRVDYWETARTAPQSENGSFFSTFSKGRHGEPIGIHHDRPAGISSNRRDNWVILIIYMTPGAPADAGTSFWQHRLTGLTQGPTTQDAKQLSVPITELQTILTGDFYKINRWAETGRVGNLYNRAVLFPSRLLHSATRHFGRNLQNGRLIQVFFFSIDPAL